MTNLGQRTISGGAIAVGAHLFRLALMLATSAVMARLLTPADFGLIAMAATVTAFTGMLADFGLSTATVRSNDVDQETISALFLLNLLAGVLVMLATLAAAPLAAWLFGDPRIRVLVMAMALSIPVTAATAQHTALLQRSMRMFSLQWTGLAAASIGTATGILLAWKTDLGYWALVAQTWAFAVSGLALTWGVCAWRPSLVSNWSGARSAVLFGINLTGVNFVHYIHRQFDKILIGRCWGAVEVGYYSRAYALFSLPQMITQPLSSVVLPAMCRVWGEPDRWRHVYLRTLLVLLLLFVPGAGLLVLLSEPIVLFLYGSSWLEVVPIIEILAFALPFQPLYISAGFIYISSGRTDRMRQAGIVVATCYVIAFSISVSGGGSAVALSYCIATACIIGPWLWWATRGTTLTLSLIFATLWPPMLAALLALILCYAVSLNHPKTIGDIFITSTLYLVTFILASITFTITNRPFRELLKDVFVALRYLGPQLMPQKTELVDDAQA
jgi:polysaccharide transporter, PST family